MVFRELRFRVPFLKDGLFAYKARYFDDQLEPGEVCLEHPIAHTSWHPRPVPIRRSYQSQRLMVENESEKWLSFDLSKVCHLVDMPITSKIKCVCLNIILMFTLGTKGRQLTTDPLTVINSASNLVTFPVILLSISPLPATTATFCCSGALKLTIIQFRIDQ